MHLLQKLFLELPILQYFTAVYNTQFYYWAKNEKKTIKTLVKASLMNTVDPNLKRITLWHCILFLSTIIF